MKLRNKIAVFSMIFLGLISCEKKLTFDSEITDSKLVVNSMFSNSEPWKVNISNSLSVIDGADLSTIDNAEVKIFNGNSLVETLIHDENGNYLGSSIPSENETYRIEVSAPTFKPVQGFSSSPPVSLELLSMDTTTTDDNFSSNLFMAIDITMKDLDPKDNYYGIRVSSVMLDTITGETQTEEAYLYSDDPIITTSFGGGAGLTVFDDLLFNGSTQNLSLNVNIYGGGNYDEFGNFIEGLQGRRTIKFELITLSQDGYLYFKSYGSYQESQYDPFSQPVQVYSNIDGGFGIFAGASSNITEIIIE